MRTYLVHLSAQAERDIDKAKVREGKRDTSWPDMIDDALEAEGKRLSQFPEIGHRVQIDGEWSETIRSWAVGETGYLLRYRIRARARAGCGAPVPARGATAVEAVARVGRCRRRLGPGVCARHRPPRRSRCGSSERTSKGSSRGMRRCGSRTCRRRRGSPWRRAGRWMWQRWRAWTSGRSAAGGAGRPMRFAAEVLRARAPGFGAPSGLAAAEASRGPG